MTQKIQIRVSIMGRVQGVCFRAETKKQADRIGLTGWVKNQPDGSVAAVFEGDADGIAQMTDWCHRGPSFSRVDRVEIETENSLSGFTAFDILY